MAHRGNHSCSTSLKMEVDQHFGQLDGYTFHKDKGITGWKAFINIISVEEDGKSTWVCEGPGCKGEKKGCRITVDTVSMKLVYPHTAAMHKCKDFVESVTEVTEEAEASEEGEEEMGFGMFG